MNAVGAEVDRPARRDKVMYPNAPLGSEVPDAGVGGRTRLRGVKVVQTTHRRVFVVGPDHSACGLYPWHQALPMRVVPAQNDGRYAGASKPSTHRIRRRALGRIQDVGRAGNSLKLRSDRLPERKDFDPVFEIALEEAVAEFGGQAFADMPASEEKAEVGAVLKADAALYQETVNPRFAIGLRRDG